MTRARALTLVELVVTISVAGILIAASIGGLMGVQTWRAASAVRKIQADLSYARARAMLSERRTLCTFNTGAQRYELAQEPQPATGTIKAQIMPRPLDDEPWRVRLANLGGGIELKGLSGLNNGELGFAADGCPVGASGKPIGKDARIRFSSGAQIVVRAKSGLSEIIWP